jgi:hypothetical protein
MEVIVDEPGHQYIEIGYWFAHLMLHAKALKFLDEGKTATPGIGSPVARSPVEPSPHLEQRKQHLSAIYQLSSQILQRVQLVEVTEIRVPFTLHMD